MVVCIPSMNVDLQTKSDISWVSLALTLTSLMGMGLLMMWNVGTKAYAYFKRKYSKPKSDAEDDDADSDDSDDSDDSVSSAPNTGSEPNVMIGDGSELLFNPEAEHTRSDQPVEEKRRRRRRVTDEQQPEMVQVQTDDGDLLDGYTGPPSELYYGPNLAMIAVASASYPTDYWRDYDGRTATPALTATNFGLPEGPANIHDPNNVLSAYPSPQQPQYPLDTQSGFGSPFLSPSERITGVKYAPSEAGVSRLEAICAYDFGASPRPEMAELFISPPATGTDFYNYAIPSAVGGPSESEIYGMYGSSNAGVPVPRSSALGPQSTSRAALIGRGALMARPSTTGAVSAQGLPGQAQSKAPS